MVGGPGADSSPPEVDDFFAFTCVILAVGLYLAPVLQIGCLKKQLIFVCRLTPVVLYEAPCLPVLMSIIRYKKEQQQQRPLGSSAEPIWLEVDLPFL